VVGFIGTGLDGEDRDLIVSSSTVESIGGLGVDESGGGF